MMGNHIKENKLIDYNLYELDGKLYLNLKYWAEDESGEYEISFPKVRLSIEKLLCIKNDSDFIIDKDGLTRCVKTSHIECLNGNVFKAIPVHTFDFGDKDCSFVIEKIKDKVQRVTLDDIEKKFGCKVEIVKEK